MKLFISIVFAAFLTSSASAGTLYKCIDSKGNSAYQETPCPKAAREAGRGYVQPVAPSQSNSWTAQKGALQRQQAQRERLYRAEVPRMIPSEGGSASNAQERQSLASQLDSQISRLGPLNSRGKRELAASLYADKAALAGANVERPTSRREPSTTQPVSSAPQAQTIRDSQGNTYDQPAGSAFARDTKTGEQCFVNGAFVHCK